MEEDNLALKQVQSERPKGTFRQCLTCLAAIPA
jgi:hypothetical protein